jgi:hypothetical protein
MKTPNPCPEHQPLEFLSLRDEPCQSPGPPEWELFRAAEASRMHPRCLPERSLRE